MKRTLIFMGIAMYIAGVPDVRGQSIGPSTINSSGGFGTIAGNDYEWSVGEMTMVSTFTTSAVIVTQGILQPSPTALGITNVASIAGALSVFPNPASTVVNISFNADAAGTLQYRLMDVAGRVIINNSANVKAGINTEQLDLAPLADGTYMLEIETKTGNTAANTITYKIQKLN